MKRGRRRRSWFLVAVGLIALLVGMARGITSPLAGGPVPVGEGLVGAGVFFLLWGVDRLLALRRWPLTRRLVILIPLSLLFWGGVVFLERWGGLIPGGRQTLPCGLLLYALLSGGLLLLVLKSLIYVQQNRSTAGRYRFLLLVMAVRALHLALDEGLGLATYRGWDEFSRDWEEIVLFVLFMFAIFLNGFRCKWMHYLNRNEKVGTFFAGTLLVGAANVLAVAAPLPGPVLSVVGASLIRDIQMVFIVYGGMALMGVLFMLPSAGLMDRRMREIHFLQGLGAMLGSVRDREELTAKTTELARRVVGADGAWLELKSTGGYQLAGVDGLKPEVIEAVPSPVLRELRRMAAEHDGLLLNDLSKEQRISGLRQGFRRTGALLAVPVRLKRQEMGMLYAISYDRFGFVEESRGLIKAFADQVAVALENLRLIQVTIDQEVFKEELRVAHDAQMRLLPQSMPSLEQANIHAFCATANEVGGDFYDVIPVGEDRMDIIVGDVSGKGASAAFYMAELKGVVQALAPHFSSPVKILTEMNGFVRRHFESDTFVTMCYAVYQPQKGQFALARAGHPPVALVREGEVRWLEPEGLGLGLATNDRFERTINESRVDLVSDDLVFFMTDGLIEARDPEEEELGESRLAEILQGLGGQTAETVVDDVKRAMEAFTSGAVRHDDVTMVALTLNRGRENNRVEGESQ